MKVKQFFISLLFCILVAALLFSAGKIENIFIKVIVLIVILIFIAYIALGYLAKMPQFVRHLNNASFLIIITCVIVFAAAIIVSLATNGQVQLL